MHRQMLFMTGEIYMQFVCVFVDWLVSLDWLFSITGKTIVCTSFITEVNSLVGIFIGIFIISLIAFG